MKPSVLEHVPPNTTSVMELQPEQYRCQRVYIFPTLQGGVFGALLITMLLGAINYNNSMAFLLCFLLTSLGMVCLLHTHRNLTGLIIFSGKPRAVFSGQQALFPIQIDNRCGITRFSITLEEKKRKEKWFGPKKSSKQLSISIPAGKQRTVYYPIKTKKRGFINIERLMLSSTFPLGIFRTWFYVIFEQKCIVYPKPDGIKKLPITTSHNGKIDCGSNTGTDDFTGFRKYRDGDPINLIAWKTYARGQGLLVKLFSGKGSQSLTLNWDSVSSMYNSTESRLSQLSYWILIAEEINIQYGLEIPRVFIKPGRGKKHKEACLEALACYGMNYEHAGIKL